MWYVSDSIIRLKCWRLLSNFFLFLLLGAFFVSCSATVNIPENRVLTNIDDLSSEINATESLSLEFTAKKAVGDSSLIVTAISSDITILPHPTVVEVDPIIGSFRLVMDPIEGRSGTVQITVSISTGGSEKIRVFSITIEAQNQAPSISSLSDQNISEDTSTGALSFTISDDNTLANALAITAQSSDTTLIPNENLILGGTGTNRTLTITPAANRAGLATISIVVSDGEKSSSATFIVTVNSVNDSPSISSIAQQTLPQNGNTGALSFTISDPETSANSLILTGSSSQTSIIPQGNIVFSGTGTSRTVTISPAAGQSGGPVTITMRVSDGTAFTETSFDVTVFPPPSSLSYSQNYYLWSPTMAVARILSPSVTGTVTSYSISPGVPAGLSFNTSTGILSGIPSSPQSETSYTVTATNAAGSTTDSFSIEVLNAFYVDSASDTSATDFTPGDGECLTAFDTCTLRAAIQEANATSGSNNIIIPSNTTVTLGSVLSIGESLSIYGEDSTTSIVSGNNAVRIFEFSVNSHTTLFKRFKIINGLVAAMGAGIYSVGGNITVDTIRFENNQSTDASTGGGAIGMSDSFNTYTTNLVISNSQFLSNGAVGSLGGGGVFMDGTSISVSDSSFTSNVGNLGGALMINGGTSTVSRSLFQVNAGNYGAAVGLWDGTATLTNNTFSQNWATAAGGAIAQINSTTATIINNTFYANQADSSGGAIFANSGVYNIKNSLFHNNIGASGAANDCLNWGTINSDSHNMTNRSFSDSACGFSGGTSDYENSNASPAILASNGGSTQTHAIATGSLAEDSGTNTGCPSVDGRNLARSDGSCDIGAFEIQ
jgi:hypothetical protein